MENFYNADTQIDLANYYAVELLEKIFHQLTPSQNSIEALERDLKKQSFNIVSDSESNTRKARVLILSSDNVEQNALTAMLLSKGIDVVQVKNNQDLFSVFSQKKSYLAAIISDHYREVGVNFLSTYFNAIPKSRRPFIIHLGKKLPYSYAALGFDAHLKPTFFMEDLIRLLPNQVKKQLH